MTKLAKAVAQAMGLAVHTNATLAGELHHGDWVELSPNCWVQLNEWAYGDKLADRLIDECRISTLDGGDHWIAAISGTWYAQHSNRKTAALLVFCKWKGFVV